MKSAIKKKRAKYVSVAVLAPLLLFASVDYVQRHKGTMPVVGVDTLLLLLPDAMDASAPVVREWMDAASEEGLHLQPIHDSEFLDPLSTVHAIGVIVPDQIHRTANDLLIGELYRYVRDGGKLMVVYDACTWDLNGRFTPGDSRLSTLVGVHYSMYDRYQTATMEPVQVTGTSAVMRESVSRPEVSFLSIVPTNWQPGVRLPKQKARTTDMLSLPINTALSSTPSSARSANSTAWSC